MQSVNILAFGIAKEILGSASLAMQVAAGTTAGALKTLLEKQYPGLAQLSSFMLALNNEYAHPDTIIRPGDEIAIIPPVSGG